MDDSRLHGLLFEPQIHQAMSDAIFNDRGLTLYWMRLCQGENTLQEVV